MCWWTSIRPDGVPVLGRAPQPPSSVAAIPSAVHPSTVRLGSSRTPSPARAVVRAQHRADERVDDVECVHHQIPFCVSGRGCAPSRRAA